MKKILNKNVLLILAVSAALSCLYGSLKKPFYLNFINGLTICALFLFALGVIRWSWIQGDYAFFSWHPGRKANETNETLYESTSYRDYRSRLRDERKDKQNPMLTAGIIAGIIAIILSIFY